MFNLKDCPLKLLIVTNFSGDLLLRDKILAFFGEFNFTSERFQENMSFNFLNLNFTSER